MTAFGRASYTSPLGRFHVEIHTLNRRHLEIHFALPQQLSRFEIEIRKWIEAKIGRGQINVSLIWRSEEAGILKVVPNLALAKALKQAWDQIAQELAIPSQVTLSLLAEQEDILIFEQQTQNESEFLNALQKVVADALNQVLRMREQEGEALASDLKTRLLQIGTIVEKISHNATNATQRYREKLKQRLEELFTGSPENEEKILREIAVFAEKIDISEEMIRLKSHVQQFNQSLNTPLATPNETRGKTLEFLIQELHREVNTIGSKSSDLLITQWVLILKGEIEKIREQVQNIE